MEFQDTTLALIGGGKASRLGGAPKGLLRLDGRTLVERHLELGRAFADVLLVANDPAPYQRYGLRTVSDVVKDKGAPGGVHAALVHARTPWVFAVAIDMPFVTLEVVRAVRAPVGEARLVAFEVGGRLEPFLGLYSTALEPQWRELLGENPSFPRVFSVLQGLRLPENDLRAVDPALRSVTNVNVPEDVARLGLAWPEGWTAKKES